MKKFLWICTVSALTISLLGCARVEVSLPVCTEYTVYYYLDGSVEQLANNKVVTDMEVDTRIAESAVLIPGYIVVGNKEQYLTLAETENVIIFYYAPDHGEDSYAANRINFTTDEINNYLFMTKNEILRNLGKNYVIVGAGAEGTEDGYFYEEQGLIFTFWPGSTTLEQLYGSDIEITIIAPDVIEVKGGFFGSDFCTHIFWPSEDVVQSISVVDNVVISGVRQGMDFSQIQEHLGKAEIIETWIEFPGNTAYKIEYQIGKGKYTFYSFEEDGTDSFLDITKDN